MMSQTTDRTFAVSTANHIDSKLWSPQGPLTWDEFVSWLNLGQPARQRDCGGFFLGRLRGKRKKSDTVISRSAINLDADKADAGFLTDAPIALAGVSQVFYTTWRHTPEAPRYRLLIPLDRDVSPAEFILISKALIEELGPHQFDPTCTQPERMMLRPSTQDPVVYEHMVVDGDPLCADEWVLRAREDGFDRVDSSIDDHGGGEPNYDPDTRPNREQIALAQVLLDKAEREVRTGFNEKTGDPFGGRNQACISRLPMLYRFVLGGCLKEDEVNGRILAAALEAEGDATFDEVEFAQVSANAWEYANLSGGRRPVVDDPAEVFDAVSDELGADEGDDTPLYPAYRPDLYFTNRGQHQTLVTAEAIRAVRPIALDAIDNRLLCYHHGVWQEGELWINNAVAAMMRNEWTQTVRNSTIEYLKDSPTTPRLRRDPAASGYVNTRSGMLDWRTGDVVEHSPDYWSTIQIPHEWDETADCPRFLAFLERVLPEDAMGFIWELIGYMLYSGNPLQVAPMLYGPGSNGKGTFLNVLIEVLGLENVASVALHDLIENRFRAAELYGKMANIAGDLDDRWLSSTGLLKQITGDDLISAERKFGASFSFRPWAVPLFSTNNVFSVSDSSEGYARRMMVIPFPNTYHGEGRAALFSGEEYAGVLRRGVEGLATLMERGRFRLPPSVEQATHKFLASGDVVRSWIDECCVLEVGGWTPRADLYASFDAYVSFTGSKPMSNRSFYNRLAQVGGLGEIKRKGVRGVSGITLKEQ